MTEKSLGNETRSGIGSFGEVPNCWQRNNGSQKADQKNVQRVGVGLVGHCILHHHEENVGALSDFLCGISHTANMVTGVFLRHCPAWMCLPILVGCATTSTSDVGQVREVAPGTYKIGVSGGAGSVVFGSHEAADAAVAQAGQYCHAKGQKLVIMPTTGHDVIFRCGEKTAPGE
jgi:hypothetical protein